MRELGNSAKMEGVYKTFIHYSLEHWHNFICRNSQTSSGASRVCWQRDCTCWHLGLWIWPLLTHTCAMICKQPSSCFCGWCWVRLMAGLYGARVRLRNLTTEERKCMGLHKLLSRRQPPPGITACSWPQCSHYALVYGHCVPGYGSLCAGVMVHRDLATV